MTDPQTRHDLETMAQWRARRDAYERVEARRRRTAALRFWFNLHQIVDDPAAASAAPGVSTPLPSIPGAAHGVAGSQPDPGRSHPPRPALRLPDNPNS